MSIAERLRELAIELPEAPPPAGNYVGAVTVGNLVFVAGHGPRGSGGQTAPAHRGRRPCPLIPNLGDSDSFHRDLVLRIRNPAFAPPASRRRCWPVAEVRAR